MEDIAARELELFADNTYSVHRRKMEFYKNLATKKARGTYDREKSLKLWEYYAKEAAQAYVKEHGSSGDKWNVMFNKESRLAFCKSQREEFEDLYKSGEFETIIPKKYQKAATKKATAKAMAKLAAKRDDAPSVHKEGFSRSAGTPERRPPTRGRLRQQAAKRAGTSPKQPRFTGDDADRKRADWLETQGITPWTVKSLGDSWYIVRGSKKKRIGAAGSRRTNHFDNAWKEADKRNKKL